MLRSQNLNGYVLLGLCCENGLPGQNCQVSGDSKCAKSVMIGGHACPSFLICPGHGLGDDLSDSESELVELLSQRGSRRGRADQGGYWEAIPLHPVED